MEIQTYPHTDELMDRYYKLSNQSEIPNMQEYAEAFHNLADELVKEGRHAMAAMCYEKADRYARTAKYLPAVRRVREFNAVWLRPMEEKGSPPVAPVLSNNSERPTADTVERAATARIASG